MFSSTRMSPIVAFSAAMLMALSLAGCDSGGDEDDGDAQIRLLNLK